TFTRTAGAEEGQELAFLDIQRDVVHRGEVAVVSVQVAQADQGLGRLRSIFDHSTHDETPRRISLRRRRTAAMTITSTDRAISSVEATAITGVRSWRRVVHIFTGRVCRVGLAIITLSTTSSQETRKANRPPATMPGRMPGKVT